MVWFGPLVLVTCYPADPWWRSPMAYMFGVFLSWFHLWTGLVQFQRLVKGLRIG